MAFQYVSITAATATSSVTVVCTGTTTTATTLTITPTYMGLVTTQVRIIWFHPMTWSTFMSLVGVKPGPSGIVYQFDEFAHTRVKL